MGFRASFACPGFTAPCLPHFCRRIWWSLVRRGQSIAPSEKGRPQTNLTKLKVARETCFGRSQCRIRLVAATIGLPLPSHGRLRFALAFKRALAPYAARSFWYV